MLLNPCYESRRSYVIQANESASASAPEQHVNESAMHAVKSGLTFISPTMDEHYIYITMDAYFHHRIKKGNGVFLFHKSDLRGGEKSTNCER